MGDAGWRRSAGPRRLSPGPAHPSSPGASGQLAASRYNGRDPSGFRFTTAPKGESAARCSTHARHGRHAAIANASHARHVLPRAIREVGDYRGARYPRVIVGWLPDPQRPRPPTAWPAIFRATETPGAEPSLGSFISDSVRRSSARFRGEEGHRGLRAALPSRRRPRPASATLPGAAPRDVRGRPLRRAGRSRRERCPQASPPRRRPRPWRVSARRGCRRRSIAPAVRSGQWPTPAPPCSR